MTKDEKNKKESELDYIFQQAESEGGEIDSDNLLMNTDDQEIEMSEVDYNEEMNSAYGESVGIIENMSDLYLNSNDALLKNKYIRNKVLTDAQNLADMFFLQKIAKRAITKQMEQIDSGEGSPRHYETLYNGMKEIRENIKQSTMTTSTMEGFYKQLRDDLGIEETIGDNDETNKGNITNQQDLNDKLDDIIKNQKKK
jgi:hypothetical protein